MIEMAARAGIEKIYVHAFLDGRDTPPKCADIYLRRLQDKLDELKAAALPASAAATTAWIVTAAGHGWKPAYDMITLGLAPYRAATALEGAGDGLRTRRDR